MTSEKPTVEASCDLPYTRYAARAAVKRAAKAFMRMPTHLVTLNEVSAIDTGAHTD